MEVRDATPARETGAGDAQTVRATRLRFASRMLDCRALWFPLGLCHIAPETAGELVVDIP
jgi:hypothetical protein